MYARLSSRGREFDSRARIFLAAGIIVLAILAAWRNGLDGAFILDDASSITENPSIRHLSDLGAVLSPPPDVGVGGRPLLNLSFALNYAISGEAVRGYHATNVAIHLLAALALFGLVRRTLRSAALDPRFGRDAVALAGATALLWALHPVQTASVTYVSQRAESLMGLFYLLTLYCFTRTVEGPRSRLWSALAVGACALGMFTKEVMVTAPLAVLLYDRTFVAGSWREAWQQRRGLYLALALTWLPVPFTLASVAERGVGSSHGVTWMTYALTESRVVLQYLGLALWPQTLVFNRGADFLSTLGDAAPYALVLVPLLAITLYVLVRRPVAGFLPAWFFGILAPTSSVMPIAYLPMAENRLYLPLAAVSAGLVLASYALAGRRGLVAALVLALAAGALTVRRNGDYRTVLGVWLDTVEKCPGNADARYNLGLLLSHEGRTAAAVAQWRASLRDDPNQAYVHNNLAGALTALGRVPEALIHYEAAIRLAPFFPVAHSNYGFLLLLLGRVTEAEAQLQLAVKQDPKDPLARTHYGLALERQGRIPEAIAAHEAALRLDPNFAGVHHNLAVVLLNAGRLPEAIAHFEAAARQQPDSPAENLDVVRVYLQAGRLADARPLAETLAVKFPDQPDAHFLLGNTLALAGEFRASAAAYERCLALKPDFADARHNLENVRARLAP